MAATIAFLVSLISMSHSTMAQEESNPLNVFKVSTNLVVVDVQVMEKPTLEPVVGLKASDFAVYEEGVRQEITQFGRDTLPLSVIFLFDITQTVRPVLSILAEGAGQTLQHLKPDDEAAVMTFTETARLLEDFTLDRQVIADAIGRASRLQSRNNEKALLNEAVYQAAAQFRKSPNQFRRRVIILLNDGLIGNLPRGEVHSEREATEELFESDSMVCGLVAQSALSKAMAVLYANNPMFLPAIKAMHPGSLQKYAQRTGGEVIHVTESNVSSRLSNLLEHLRARYSLGYSSTKTARDGKFRPIKVKLSPDKQIRSGKKLVIWTKEGYFAR